MSKETKMTVAQKEVLIEFMEDHEEFSKGKLLGSAGKKKKMELWNELTARLNACEGPSKNAIKWQKVWIDLKNKIKKKAGEVRRHHDGTGGGPKCKTNFTELEEKVIAILTQEAIHGLEAPSSLPLDSAEPDHKKGVEVIYIKPSSAVTSPQATTDESEGDVGPRQSTSREEGILTISEDEETSRGSTPLAQATPSFRKRRRTQPTSAAAEAAETFRNIGEALNNKVDCIIEVMEALVKEKQETNHLLRELINCFQQNK